MQHPRSSSDPPPLNPLVACRRYEPREHRRPLALARPEIPPSPLSDRVGYSDHDRFRGYFPVHCIPAYSLPVYASQWPLPDTTQDLVRGCSLGFTAAAISGDRVQRAFKAQRSWLRRSKCLLARKGSFATNVVRDSCLHRCRQEYKIVEDRSLAHKIARLVAGGAIHLIPASSLPLVYTIIRQRKAA